MLCILGVHGVTGGCADLPINPSYPVRVVLRTLARQCSRLELIATQVETDGKRKEVRREERERKKGEGRMEEREKGDK